MHLGFSSNYYPLDVKDLLALPNSDLNIKTSDDVILLLGNKEKNIPDSLLCGRDKLEEALKQNQVYIDTRICFVPTVGAYNIFAILVKKIREKGNRVWSTNYYHIDPNNLRQQNIERGKRTQENAYALKQKRFYIPEEERKRLFTKLKDSLKNGYDDTMPITIMPCRRAGLKDSLREGHHRLGICIDIGLDRITTDFVYVAAMPLWIQRLRQKPKHNIKKEG